MSLKKCRFLQSAEEPWSAFTKETGGGGKKFQPHCSQQSFPLSPGQRADLFSD